jgi:hypothetical protein
LKEYDIANLTELYKRSCRELNKYKGLIAACNFDLKSFPSEAQELHYSYLRSRIKNIEETADQHLRLLLAR